MVIDTWAKWDFETWPFLWFLEAKMINLTQIDFQLGKLLNIIGNYEQSKLKSISQKMWPKWLIFGPK